MATTLTPAEIQAIIARMGLTFVGPVVMGTVFNAFLTGINAMMYTNYFTSGYKDPKYTRILVAWCAVVDTFAFGACLSFLWQYAVENYGNPRLAYTSHFAYAGNAVMSVCVSVPIQFFLGYRIKLLCGNKKLGNIIFAMIIIPSILQGAFGFTTSTCLIKKKLTVFYRPCIKWSTACVICTIVCDLMLTGFLFYYLAKSRSTFKRTNNLISRIIVRSVETCAFLTLFCACALLYYAFPGTGVHLAFNLPLGRVYCLTLMTTLNTRPARREDSDGTRSASMSGANRNPVQISVQKDVQQEFPLNRFQTKAVPSMNESDGDFDMKRIEDMP